MVPVILNEEELFKFNTSSEYYKDLCFTYTTEEGTDITLDDRKNEYIDKNMSLCESNCEYTGYKNTTKKAVCNCKVKKNITLSSEIIIDNQDILNKFFDIRNRINLKVMKCFKLLFSKKGLISNIGSYVLLSILFTDIIIAILFAAKGFVILYNKIKFIRTMLNLHETTKKINNKINRPKKKKKNNKDKIEKVNFGKGKFVNKDKKDKKKSIKQDSDRKLFNPIKNKAEKKKKKKVENSLYNMTNGKLMKHFKKKDINRPENNNEMNVVIFPKKKIDKKKNSKKEVNYYKYNDYEMNHFIYKEAQKLDKRTFFQYYFSLLKTKQILIFTFYTNTDYNSRYIKICLFLFTFALYLTINTLFFGDSKMHQIYQDQGTFIFYIIYQQYYIQQ